MIRGVKFVLQMLIGVSNEKIVNAVPSNRLTTLLGYVFLYYVSLLSYKVNQRRIFI